MLNINARIVSFCYSCNEIYFDVFLRQKWGSNNVTNAHVPH
jgi:hypothetical protein